MAANFGNIGEDQGWSTRGTETTETNQQNHQTGIQSMTNRTSPESEQYTREFNNPIYQPLNGTKASKTKGKQKARCFESRQTSQISVATIFRSRKKPSQEGTKLHTNTT